MDKQVLLLDCTGKGCVPVDHRALHLFKAAEFLNEAFTSGFSKNRACWSQTLLDPHFFELVNKAENENDEAKRQKILEEAHLYCQDFLMLFIKEFFDKCDKEDQLYLIHAGNFLHPKMEEKKVWEMLKDLKLIK